MSREETPLTNSFSGARVYRTIEDGEARVVKVSEPDEPVDEWRARVKLLQLAADAGVAPPVRRADESSRSVATRFVDGTIFPLIGNPATRSHALRMIGKLLRRVHELPLPKDAQPASPTAFLASTWAELEHQRSIPTLVRDAVDRMLKQEVAPAIDRPAVLSHNDVHPANLVVDGDKLMLVDWDQAGANDPFYDLAAISLFLNLSHAECKTLISAHDGVAVESLPPRFVYDVRMVGTMCGAMFLKLGGVASGGEPLSLTEFYQRMREGKVDLANNEGKWQFAMALTQRGIEFSDA